MNYSIDYHNSKISGWVGNPKDVEKISLHSPTGLLQETAIGEDRIDVYERNLATEKRCGFVFSKNIESQFNEGRLFLVKIKTKHAEFAKCIFVGGMEKWSKNFEDFQVPDRSDFSMQNGPAKIIFKDNNDIIAFKLLMIRLRRGKRAFGGRGKFEGHYYKEMESDWILFRTIFESYFEILSELLTIRSLWSVVDTYTDFGTPIEKLAGLAISNFMYQERFAQTARRIYKFEEISTKKLHGQSHYWGGMLSNQLSIDDAYDVFLTKNIESLELAPILKKCFGVIFLASLNEDSSLTGMNRKHSPHFNEVFGFYKNYFEKYLKP